jgi:hypothetical protein
VRVDHGAHRRVADGAARKRKRRSRGFGAGERIDDNETGVAYDDGHVRHVEAADLIDAVADSEDACAGQEPRVAPEAGVHAVRRFALEEIVSGEIPDDSGAVGAADVGLVAGGIEAARCKVLIFAV